MLKTLSRMLIAALALAGVIALVTGLLLIRGGISAKATPGEFETTLARRARTLAIPRSARDVRKSLSRNLRVKPSRVQKPLCPTSTKTLREPNFDCKRRGAAE